MKKNRMMRIAAVMMVIALATTCIISGTFAKYATAGGPASDAARVAKWGVTVAVSDAATAIFDTEYDGTVLSAVSGEKVVAPGTEKTDAVAPFTITGTPEVSCRIVYTATVDLGDNWTVTVPAAAGQQATPEIYCPLVITVGGTDYEIDYTKNDPIADFEGRVADAIAASSDTYNPGDNLGNVATVPEIGWHWTFSDATNEDEITANDVKDTILGDAHNATVSISVSVKVIQVD